MANFLYDIAVNGTFAGSINWNAGTNFKCIGVNSSYTPSASSHSHLSDVSSGDRETSGVAISGVSFTGRKFKFSGLLFPAVTSGHTITYVILYIDTGTESTSTLLYCCDTGTNLPVTGTGADISFTPDATAGLFSL